MFQTGAVTYDIIKTVDSRVNVQVVVTVTSAPIPGVQQIAVTSRVNANKIQFSSYTQVFLSISFVYTDLYVVFIKLF